MILLAITSVSGSIGYASLALCIALIIYAVIPWPSDRRDLVKPSLSSLGIRFFITSAAIFVWLAVALPLLGWAFWIGDNDHWFWHYAWVFAILIAVTVAAIAIWRIFKNGATVRYLRIQQWVSIALLFAFATAYGYESLHRIEGFTAESAARSVFDRLTPYVDGPVTLVEDLTPPRYGQDPKNYKSYWIMGPDEPRGRFTISRHQWFGWVMGGNQKFRPSADELNRAKERLSQSSHDDGAVLILQHIVVNYPDTPAATEARELLKSLGAPLNPKIW